MQCQTMHYYNVDFVFLDKVMAVSLQDVLMFATGLSAMPPAGIAPPPSIEFFKWFNVANGNHVFKHTEAPTTGLLQCVQVKYGVRHPKCARLWVFLAAKGRSCRITFIKSGLSWGLLQALLYVFFVCNSYCTASLCSNCSIVEICAVSYMHILSRNTFQSSVLIFVYYFCCVLFFTALHIFQWKLCKITTDAFL